MAQADQQRLLDRLRDAISQQRLHMLFQPQVSLADGKLVAVEALVRWDDPELGAVSPSRFVTLAEEHGLIDDLTHWGLHNILGQWIDWRAMGLDTMVAFNISALSLQYLDFPDTVERMCRELKVPPDRLVLELTEGATQPLINLMDTLTRFRIKGIGLAIDDFGTGYSSIMQLRKLPFTEVKIDREFVSDLERSSDCRLIVESIAGLARGLGLQSCAEGIETAAQLRAVRDIGCDRAQGYLISPALEASELKSWSADFETRWRALAGASGGDIEADALGER